MPVRSTSMCSPDGFPLFSRLPAELRIQIWEFSLPPPRIVYLEKYSFAVSNPNPLSCFYDGQVVTGFRSQARPPVLLSVCHESRRVAQESYVEAFGTDGTPTTTWIDFERDTVYLPWAICDECLALTAKSYQDQGPTPIRFGGTFLKELHTWMKFVRTLALSGVWSPGSLYRQDVGFLNPFSVLLQTYHNLEMVLLVDSQHSTDSTAALVVADERNEAKRDAEFVSADYPSLLEYSDWVREMDQMDPLWSAEIAFRTIIAKPDIENRKKSRWRSFPSLRKLLK